MSIKTRAFLKALFSPRYVVKAEDMDNMCDSVVFKNEDIASASTLGVIKVGSRLSVAADGTLSAADQSYTLPIAASDTLGGVKVGSRLSISESGELSANDQSYTLPTATDSVLGGIKVGDTLSINSGVLDVNNPTYFKKQTLTAAQIKTAYSSPITVDIAAPGSGKAICVLGGLVISNYNTTAFSNRFLYLYTDTADSSTYLAQLVFDLRLTKTTSGGISP
jgi:hypothetical protein